MEGRQEVSRRLRLGKSMNTLFGCRSGDEKDLPGDRVGM